MSDTLTKLELRVIENEKRGQEWVETHSVWLQLDESKKNFLASLINDMERQSEGKLSESKLERLARGSKDYINFITGLCVARTEELRAKVKYDNALDLFRAIQSAQAFEREKLKHLGETL